MENVDNIILEYLSVMRAGIAGLRNNLQGVKQRLTGIQAEIGGLERGAGDLIVKMWDSMFVMTACQHELKRSSDDRS